MRLGLITDIHANREAFEACLARLGREGYDQLAILGDIVGYGADPAYAVQRTMELADKGAIVLRGNHDQALVESQWVRNPQAREIIEWTRHRLSAAEIAWLQALPLSVELADVLLVHASAHEPAEFPYVRNPAEAALSLDATTAGLTLCGHTHKSSLYGRIEGGEVEEILPAPDAEISLAPPRRWVAVIGSAGLPRGGTKGACCATYDMKSRRLAYARVGFEAATTARKMRDAGPPGHFADLVLKSA